MKYNIIYKAHAGIKTIETDKIRIKGETFFVNYKGLEIPLDMDKVLQVKRG